LVGGNFNTYDSNPCNDYLVRLNTITGQKSSAIAIGSSAGRVFQQTNAIAIGNLAGQTSQQANAIAIGNLAGETSQQSGAVAIGQIAGQTSQQTRAVAIGLNAGETNQGSNAIAIGYQAGQSNQPADTIAIGANTTPTALDPIQFKAGAAGNTVVNFASNLTYNFTTGGTKTFVIDHPLDPTNKYLIHACLEGPEAGVYYRGSAFISVGSNSTELALPIYVNTLATEFTVHVTPVIIDNDNDYNIIPTLACSRVKNGKFCVYGNRPCAFDYLVFGKRCDINVEPLKTAVTVKGSGPYTWI
jgi:hypothetical protein